MKHTKQNDSQSSSESIPSFFIFLRFSPFLVLTFFLGFSVSLVSLPPNDLNNFNLCFSDLMDFYLFLSFVSCSILFFIGVSVRIQVFNGCLPFPLVLRASALGRGRISSGVTSGETTPRVVEVNGARFGDSFSVTSTRPTFDVEG